MSFPAACCSGKSRRFSRSLKAALFRAASTATNIASVAEPLIVRENKNERKRGFMHRGYLNDSGAALQLSFVVF